MSNLGLPLSMRDWHPEVMAVVLVFLGAYFYCLGPLRERHRLAAEVSAQHIRYALLAALSVYIAEGSPLHALSERYLFSAHMLQHVLLILVMPPLVLAALPGWLVEFFLRPRWLKGIARCLVHPVVAFIAFNGVYAAWHLPFLYQLALRYHWLHFFQHVTMVVTAFMMWWPLRSPTPQLPRLSYGGQVVYLFLMVAAQLPVFAPITYAPAPLYRYYAEAPRVLGLSPLVDQQWAGIIMKVSGMAVMLAVLAVTFFRWARNDAVESPVELTRRHSEEGWTQQQSQV